VAKAMQWSLSKVIRIEKGEVNVSANDLRVLLEHLDVTDEELVRQLLEDAWLSRQERWQIDSADREHMTPAMLEYFQFESAANTVRCYNNVIMPGILQTRAYAEALFRNSPPPAMSAETMAARVEVRRARQKRILYGESGPDYLALLDESVLYRPLGGAAAMADQLDSLLVMMRDTRLVVRIVPFNVAQIVDTFVGPFILYDLEEDQSALLYRESWGRDETVESEAEIGQHRSIFDRMWAHALDDNASRDLISQWAEKYRREATG
jgi:hypothetical protein